MTKQTWARALRGFFAHLVVGGFLLALPAIAQSFDAQELPAAKAAGKIGEQADGYLGVVSQERDGPDAALARTINEARLAAYQQIAKETGAPVDAVAARAGARLIAESPAGTFVRDAAGQWVKK